MSSSGRQGSLDRGASAPREVPVAEDSANSSSSSTSGLRNPPTGGDDPFASPGNPATATPEGLPGATDLLNKVIAEVQKDFAGFFIGGLGALIVAFLIIPFSLVAVYGGMFAGMIPGLLLEDEAVTGLGSMVGLFAGMFALIFVIVGLTAPMGASTTRAVWRYLTTGEKLTFMAPFSTITQDLFRVLAFALLQFVVVFTLAMFCYLPGLIAAAYLVFAGPLIIIHRMPIGQAVSMSVAHVQQHGSWHIGFFGIAVVMQLVLSYVPIVGPVMLATCMPLYILLAYRHVYGDGEVPRGI
jgi:hypothetical protein